MLPQSILVVGSGGREMAIAQALLTEDPMLEIHAAPGNPGMGMLGIQCWPIKATDIDGLLKLAQENNIELTIVGPEAPLINGIVDVFEAHGLKIYGPSAEAARIEGSKAYCAEVCAKAEIRMPATVIAKDLQTALNFINIWEPQEYVIKADGPAAGKGVVLPKSYAEAKEIVHAWMERDELQGAGSTLVFQKRIHGWEFSALYSVGRNGFVGYPFAQDHKRLLDDDEGPNTGGMGAIAPVGEGLISREEVNDIIRKLLNVINFKGTIFLGLMRGDDGFLYVLEINCRFDDPETETVLPLVKSGLLKTLWGAATETLDPTDLVIHSSKFAATTVVTAKNYALPGSVRTGDQIVLSNQKYWEKDNLILAHMGTKLDDGILKTNGGRVAAVTAVRDTLTEAIVDSRAGAMMIDFPGMHYREDIGRSYLKMIREHAEPISA
jgi:phosphoribosylamine--glycine ligase